jgi:secreted trypsin-like serine protease
MIRSIGYGQNDQSSPIGTRFRKAGVAVLAQGKAVSPSKTPLGAHEFEVGMSICQGDSGGPAISEETGAVIGVVSRGGGCSEDFGHIYTTTSGFDQMFDDAFTLAGATPKSEAGDIAGNVPSTRTRSTSQAEEADVEDAAAHAGCSVGPRTSSTSSGTGAMGAVVLAAAVAAIGARRRRAR